MRKEILQATMISLTRVLPRLDYDREKSGFRALLCTIVRNHLRSAWRRNRAVVVDAGLPDWEIDRMVDENPQANPEAVWDRLWRQNILLQALERARRQVEPSTYESFSRHVLSGQSAAVVARDLGMTVNAVHQHRHRLIVILRRHVRELCLEVGENVEERANGL
jgi:RNA polymerase sigma factor (sigma-70 family)